MACLPIIERELRVALRKRRPTRSRLKVAAAAAGGAMLFLLLGGPTGSRNLGRELDELLCMAGLYFVVRAPRLTAGVLAEERRNQTLGLLFLSGLGAGEVFASKFLSAALVAFTDLLALFPMLALPFLIGGVSFELFLATIFGLPALMLFALAVSLLGSVLTQDDGTAVVLAMVVGAGLCVLMPAIYLAQTHFSPGAAPSLWWLRLSPAYGPHLVWDGLRSGFGVEAVREFWLNLGVTFVWSALCLGAASTALKLLWRDREEKRGSAGWLGRWHNLIHGTAQERRRLGRVWLEVNPFVWLAGRDRQPATLAWGTLGGGVLLWLVCWAAWPVQWPSVPNFFLTATLLNSALGWMICQAAARSIAEPRRDGIYELLLTTPLRPSDVVWGQLEALRWHFHPLLRVVLGLEVVMLLAGLVVRGWSGPALAVYFTLWASLLFWTWSLGRRRQRVLHVMWISLNCGRPAHAVWRSLGLNSWSWIWILFNLNNVKGGFSRFPAFPTGSLVEVALMSGGALILLLVVLIKRKGFWDGANHWERRLTLEFREIVREPLPDPTDPRFKKWDVRERFPWGWEMVQHQLYERLSRGQSR
jgi:ABC-type transport system involved in multi-copper enzyme maturation permease subunit